MRPTILHVGGVLYWTIQTRNPDTMVLKDADSTPSVVVRKNGAAVGDSVTITKRSATTGIYDCSYNPAAEAEGDSFTLEESATVTGTTTSSAIYSQTWNCRVVAVERGTDNALLPTVSGRTLNVSVAGEGDAVLNSEYLFDNGFGRKAVNANVTHYQGTLQGNGNLPAKLDAIKDVTNKIDTGLVLDGVVWQFTVNMLEAAIAEVPKYGDIQRHAQEDYDVTSKTVDVTVTKVT